MLTIPLLFTIAAGCFAVAELVQSYKNLLAWAVLLLSLASLWSLLPK